MVSIDQVGFVLLIRLAPLRRQHVIILAKSRLQLVGRLGLEWCLWTSMFVENDVMLYTDLKSLGADNGMS